MSRNEIPMVRQTSWFAIVPQILLMSLLVLIFYKFDFREPIMVSCVIYLILSYGLKQVLAKDHAKGIQCSRRNDFTEAIKFYQKSAEFFKTNKWIDKYRSITLLSASKITYREMALLNIAFCYAQIGNGEKSIELYKEALLEYPNSGLAISALKMLESAQNIESKKANVLD
ncbi:MAG: tetratricopeptide repeat protein [Flavobacteriaceae bacterium]|jgi:tetratricopeptide (TPR) repeat protein|nr:tetratricopeptide repeat protein [Flavobacteriaceae bacterium]